MSTKLLVEAPWAHQAAHSCLVGPTGLARFEGDLSVADVTDAELGDVWDITQTRQRGESFLKGQSSCILRVPSAVVPEEHTRVFNPLHPQASALQLVYSRRFSFDGRLL